MALMAGLSPNSAIVARLRSENGGNTNKVTGEKIKDPNAIAKLLSGAVKGKKKEPD